MSESDPRDDVDAAIEAYRLELAAEAELAAGDLDEIEDHLRELIAELRAAGRGAEAIAVARRRLGDPRAVAREHARVRSPFGARPSRLRAWSAAALLAPMVVWWAWTAAHGAGAWSRLGMEAGLAAVLVVALAARLSWARAFLLGQAVASTITMALGLWLWPWARTQVALQLVAYAGVAAFLVPWRRGELTAAGAALALLVPAYTGASMVVAFKITGTSGDLFCPTAASIALIAALAAGAGLLLRARWGCVAAAACAIALASTAHRIWDLRWRVPHPVAERLLVVGLVVGGAVAAAGAAVLAWRDARSGVGTLRGLAS